MTEYTREIAIVLVIALVIIAMTAILITCLSPVNNGKYHNSNLSKTGTEQSVAIEYASGLPAGDKIIISGSTSLPKGSMIFYEIISANARNYNTNPENFDGTSGYTIVTGRNETRGKWSVGFDPALWRDGKYFISVWPGESGSRYGDEKIFYIPLNDTVMNGAGTQADCGKIVLFEDPLPGEFRFPEFILPEETPLPSGDFKVKILEYYDHVNNKSGVISMNYSEIVAGNYVYIPTPIDSIEGSPDSYCGFTPDSTLYSEIFLKNESVREMLRDGGLIVLTYTDKARCTHPDNCDPCQWFNVAMDILYKGEWYEARIFNESNGKVDQIHHGGKTEAPYSVFSY